MNHITVTLGSKWDPCFFWALQNCSYNANVDNNYISLEYQNSYIHVGMPKTIEYDFTPTRHVQYIHFDKTLLRNFKTFKKDNNIDSIIMAYTNGERVGEYFNAETWQNFLDDNNFLLLTTADYPNTFIHNNIFFSPFLNLIKWFYYTGYRYLNFYPQEQKSYLLGHYHGNRSEDYSADWRNRISNNLRNILNNDYHIYSKLSIPMEDIVDSVRWTGNLVWDKNHATSYLDYNQSAVNILWDSEDEYGVHRFTEKTLKAILFAKAEIFFMWYGPLALVKDLQAQGFWFLNFEFLDYSSNTPLEDSLYKTAEYLKLLRQQFSTITDLHKFLLEKYGHRLESNSKNFDNILRNCPYEEKFLQALIA